MIRSLETDCNDTFRNMTPVVMFLKVCDRKLNHEQVEE